MIKTDYTCTQEITQYPKKMFQFAAKFWCINYSSRNDSIVLILGIVRQQHYMDFSIGIENDPL